MYSFAFATAARKSAFAKPRSTGSAAARSTAGAVTLARSRSVSASRRRRAVANASGTRGVGVDDEVQPPRQVVDDRDLLALDEQHVGRAERIGERPRARRRRQPRLDVADRVVAEVAGEAAAKARQPGPERDPEALLVGGDEVDRVAFVGLDDAPVGDDLGAKAGRAQQRARRQADERVAAEALAADHRLEQEAVAPGDIDVAVGTRELEVERQWRLEVGERLGDQRDAVESLQRQALEFEFGHRMVAGGRGLRVWRGAAARQV